MKVKGLQEILKQYPDNMPVMVQGYEGGYDDVVSEGIITGNIFLGVNKEVGHYGDHAASFPDEYEDDEYKSVEALILLRGEFNPVYADEGLRKGTHKSNPEVSSGPFSKVFYLYSTSKPYRRMMGSDGNFNGDVDRLMETIKQWGWHTSIEEASKNWREGKELWTIVLYCMPCDKTFNITEPQTDKVKYP